jgi:hypothetical protein
VLRPRRSERRLRLSALREHHSLLLGLSPECRLVRSVFGAYRSAFVEMRCACRGVSLAVPTDAHRTSTASLGTRRDTVRAPSVSVGVPCVTKGTRGEMPRVPKEAPSVPRDALAASCDALAIPCDALAVPHDALAIPHDAPAVPCDVVGIRDDALLASCDALAASSERPPTPGLLMLTRDNASRVHRAFPS